jgi:hypothetical protein
MCLAAQQPRAADAAGAARDLGAISAHTPRRSIARSNAGGFIGARLVHQPHFTTRWRTAAVCGCSRVLTDVSIYQPSSGAANAERSVAKPDNTKLELVRPCGIISRTPLYIKGVV